jgi:hypothetical protein
MTRFCNFPGAEGELLGPSSWQPAEKNSLGEAQSGDECDVVVCEGGNRHRYNERSRMSLQNPLAECGP